MERGPGGEGLRPYYFLEVNPRLQVEHPVTEMVTGLDLVEWQLRIAAGEPLPLSQEGVTFTGHAIEFRINAEDPWNDFRPSSGRIIFGHWGEIERCDIGFEEGDAVPSQYDSLAGKIVVTSDTREDALLAARIELEGTYLMPLRTNVDLHRVILRGAPFWEGLATVNWLEECLADVLRSAVAPAEVFAAAAVALLHPRPWIRPGGDCLWLSDQHETGEVRVTFSESRGGQALVGMDNRVERMEFHVVKAKDVDEVWRTEYTIGFAGGESVEIRQRHDHLYCDFQGRTYRLTLVPPPPLPRRAHAAAEGATAVTAPLAGTIAAVRVAVGDVVEVGQLLATLEAMKMEHRITATDAGTVASVAVGSGDVVREGDVLVELA